MGKGREVFWRERRVSSLDARFTEQITSEDQLRAVMGWPAPRALAKEIPRLDGHCCEFIARSPFLLISSCGADGSLDISPKGDPAGFVRVLDDTTLAVPDRPGNRRADTFRNLFSNPQVGLLFLVPGKRETLRVGGRAIVVRDEGLRKTMAVAGRVPDFALVVRVEQAFFHCAKCVIRAQLWQPDAWPASGDLASHARCLADQTNSGEPLEQIEAAVQESYRTGLY